MKIEEFFQHLWSDYVKIAPAAERLHHLIEEEGEKVVNDHVAFRTYDVPPIDLAALEPHILALGYKRYEPYYFEEKKLRAFGYVPPEPDKYPRIFLSELETGKFSEALQQTVRGLCNRIDPARVGRPDVLWAGRLWEPITYDTYLKLLDESEYAAWVAVMGLRANHFTISVNHLRKLNTIEKLADFIESKGYRLNTSGGRIKGNREVLLKQGSTMADKVLIEFAGGDKHMIPSCYYEFAERFPTPDGILYQGFVAASADRIFESTNVNVNR